MPTPTTFAELVDGIIGFINILIPLIFGVVFLFLVWKIFDSWVINAADEKKREEGKQYAIVASIVMVLMIIAWGVVAMIRGSIFGF
jgi:heme/copper-type cytochrome/quinol oxidase subunit 2